MKMITTPVPERDLVLVLIDEAGKGLAEAKTIPEAVKIRDWAAAVERHRKRREGAERAARSAMELRLKAERVIGELLKPHVTRGHMSKSIPEGISRTESSKFQRIASLPESIFKEEMTKPEVSTKRLVQVAKKREALIIPERKEDTCTVDDLDELARSGRKFGTIYADPPWPYENQGTRASTDNHYGTMTVEEISALPISELVAEDAHLHLWTTNAFLQEAFVVMKAWGFDYKSVFVWVKPQLGIGNYWRVSHEFMLFGKRGNAPFEDHSLKSWLEMDRTRHSKKPDEVRKMVECASPNPRLELFGREAVKGWAVWGNEVERDSLLEKSLEA